MRRIVLFLLALTWMLPLSAQPDSTAKTPKREFRVTASAWSRGEIRDGAMPDETGADHAAFIMSNAVLGIDYRYRGLEMRLSPKYFGVWGSSSNGGLAIEEGWFGLRHKSGLFFRLGRQILSYDDQRIIGANDWVMASNKHDLLLMGLERERHKLHLMLAFNQNDSNTEGGLIYLEGGQPYKSMESVWYHVDPVKQLGASLLFMNVGMQDPSFPEENVTHQQQLFGAYADWHPRNFSLQASYYRQTGRDEYDLAIRAWMTSAEAAWQMTPRWRLNSGYFHMSGDENFNVPPQGAFGMARKTQVHGFNPIFGSHHQFYGAMDFFYVTTYYGGNTPGLQDFHAGIRWKPVPVLEFEAEYHYLATSVAMEDAVKTLGHEVELSASWQLMPDVRLLAGYSFMQGTETMELLKRTSDKNRLHWGWLMLVITPEFFSTKW